MEEISTVEDLDKIIVESSRLIQSICEEFNIGPHVLERPLAASAAVDDEVEQIHRVCETVDRNLTPSAVRPSTLNTNDQGNAGTNTIISTPPRSEIIDLCNVETPPVVSQCDNDVVFVTEQQYDVFELPVSRRRRLPNRRLSTLDQRVRSRSPSRQPPASATRSMNMNSIAIEQNQPTTSTAVPAPPPVDERPVLKCPICLDPANNPTSTKCGHVFCNGCICEALRVSRKCPICKKSQTVKMLLRLYV